MRGEAFRETAVVVPIPALDARMRGKIVVSRLGWHGKALDEAQMRALTASEAAGDLQWLLLACEDLRVLDDPTRLTEHIRALPPTVDGLIRAIIERLKGEDTYGILERCLLLLACSWSSLAEDELQALLGRWWADKNKPDISLAAFAPPVRLPRAVCFNAWRAICNLCFAARGARPTGADARAVMPTNPAEPSPRPCCVPFLPRAGLGLCWPGPVKGVCAPQALPPIYWAEAMSKLKPLQRTYTGRLGTRMCVAGAGGRQGLGRMRTSASSRGPVCLTALQPRPTWAEPQRTRRNARRRLACHAPRR